jgi:hypothetical protein
MRYFEQCGILSQHAYCEPTRAFSIISEVPAPRSSFILSRNSLRERPFASGDKHGSALILPAMRAHPAHDDLQSGKRAAARDRRRRPVLRACAGPAAPTILAPAT